MTRIEEINKLLLKEKEQGNISIKDVSDGHHSFKDLYKHRIILFCSLCNLLTNIAWKSKKHFDEENDPMFNDSFIAGINTPLGVVTYHIRLEFWELFAVSEIERAPKYDYCSDEEIFRRILSLNSELLVIDEEKYLNFNNIDSDKSVAKSLKNNK